MSTTTVINAKCAITPFAGKIDGRLTQSLESFISSVDAHIVVRGLNDRDLVLNEAKSHLDLSNGDIGDWSRSLGFNECKSWDELKTFLRDIYGEFQQQGMVRDLSEIFRLVDRKQNKLISNMAKCFDKINQLAKRLESSDWIQGDNDVISLDNFSKLIHLSID